MQKSSKFKVFKQFIGAFIGGLSGSIALLAIAGTAVAGEADHYEQWGKFIYHDAEIGDDHFDRLSAIEINALAALLAIESPLNSEISMREYAIAVDHARLYIHKAKLSSPNSFVVQPMLSAIAHHELALQFWDDCSKLLTNEMFCNENIDSVKAVLQKYPKPRNVEGILPDVTEVLRRYPKPWLNTRVRISRSEVVEYVPVSEQKRALVLLWEQAQADTERAELLIHAPFQFSAPVSPRFSPSRLY